MLRKIHKINEETRRQRRHDHIGGNFADTAQTGSKNTQFAAVTHFNILTETLRLGFAEAVSTITEQPHRDTQRHQQCRPECRGKTGAVMNFHI